MFAYTSAFNQDVSKWNTGAVTTMKNSKCTLSSCLLATAPSVVVCLNIYDNSRFVGSQKSHTCCSFYCVCGLKRDLVVVCGGFGSFFSLLHPTVFRTAYAFNQDVSKWDTRAVTNMYQSKCTRSLYLWPRRVFRCYVVCC